MCEERMLQTDDKPILPPGFRRCRQAGMPVVPAPHGVSLGRSQEDAGGSPDVHSTEACGTHPSIKAAGSALSRQAGMPVVPAPLLPSPRETGAVATGCFSPRSCAGG